MSELEITGERTLSVWWLLIWRAATGAALLGGIGGVIIGVVTIAIGHREWGPWASAALGYLLSFPWFFVVVGMALRKRYRDFRIVLVSRDTP